MIKVLHINTEQSGGAALCAQRINKALVKEGIESRMLFAHGDIVSDGIVGAIAKPDKDFWYSNSFLGKIKHIFMRMPWYMDEEKMMTLLKNKNSDNLYLHIPLTSYKSIVYHPFVEWADIIHLHWVAGFVDYPSFFKKIRKPIVWTLHDMYPVIGVMHFESDYTIRPSALDEIDALSKRIKRKAVSQAKKLNLVAISEKMSYIIKTSEIFKGLPITKIHNGVDTNIYIPKDINKSTYFQNIANDTLIFMFSSYVVNDKRKGIDRVIAALEKVKSITKRNIAMIAVGMSDAKDAPMASFPIHYTGLISKEDELSKVYSVADYYINASYEEAFAQANLEAMACGTPVISTPCSGATDLIRPFNGIVCDGFGVSALQRGIIKAMFSEYDAKKIRKYIINNFDYKTIVHKYVELYDTVLSTP